MRTRTWGGTWGEEFGGEGTGREVTVRPGGGMEEEEEEEEEESYRQLLPENLSKHFGILKGERRPWMRRLLFMIAMKCIQRPVVEDAEEAVVSESSLSLVLGMT